MTAHRWLLSAAILFHVTAVAVATVPSPADVDTVAPPLAGEGDPPAGVLAPVLERAARGVAHVQSGLYPLLSPVRGATGWYARAGVRQRWRMFANPPTDDRFIRLDYHVRAGGSASGLQVHSELVLPVGAGEWLRYFRGKAIRNALDTYLQKEYGYLGITLNAGEDVDARLFSELVPIVRHFRGRFARQRLASTDRIARTEVWYGWAPIPPPGRRVPDRALAGRQARLQQYRQPGPHRTASSIAPPPRGVVVRDAGITWRLEYAE